MTLQPPIKGEPRPEVPDYGHAETAIEDGTARQVADMTADGCVFVFGALAVVITFPLWAPFTAVGWVLRRLGWGGA